MSATRGATAAVPIVGFGAGSHAKSVVEAIRSAGRFDIVAFVDEDPARAGADLLGCPVRPAAELENFRANGVTLAFSGVGGVGQSSGRRHVCETLLAAGFELPAIVHAAAIVSPRARLGRGSQVHAGAIVNADSEVGEGAIVNTGAIVEHDCLVGAYVHVAPGARLAGLVSLGEGAHVGIGAVVIECVRIGADALVAAGAVVVDDLADGARVAGVPARPLA